MQSTIYFLQQQLRQTREQLYAAQKETEVLKNPEKIIRQEVAEADRTEDVSTANQTAMLTHTDSIPSPEESNAKTSSDGSPDTTPDDNRMLKSNI